MDYVSTWQFVPFLNQGEEERDGQGWDGEVLGNQGRPRTLLPVQSWELHRKQVGAPG